MTILDQLAAHARQRVAADQEKHSLHELKARCKEAGRAGGEGRCGLLPDGTHVVFRL